jgi:hypothetical protein
VGVHDIVSQIDREIAQLKQARALLSGAWSQPYAGHLGFNSPRVAKKRNLTPEGRKRIAEAVRRRWARQKGEAGQIALAS